MALTLKHIWLDPEFQQLTIREVDDDGKEFTRILTPDMDVSSEDPEVQEKAGTFWTDEVKAAWAAYDPEAPRI